MKAILPYLILSLFIMSGCGKMDNPPITPEIVPPTDSIPAKPPLYTLNEYDAAYSSKTGTYSYHVRNLLYYPDGKNFAWSTVIIRSHDTLYYAEGSSDSSLANTKGCIALVSNIAASQQANYNYFIGSYYKFALFNDTTVGNLQFMIPTDNFPSIDSIPVGVAMLNFYGGLRSYYKGMAKSEIKIKPDLNFVQVGDSLSYANPLIPAAGTIDSTEVHMLVTRFSDNGFHPTSRVTKTMDANYSLRIQFKDSTYLSIINGKFINLFFQKEPM